MHAARQWNLGKIDQVHIVHITLSKETTTTCVHTYQNIYLNSLDVKLSWLAIKYTILGVMELFVPEMKSAVLNTQPVWFDNTIRHQVKCLRIMTRKVKQRFSLDKLKRLQEAEDKLQRSIVMTRINYKNKLINDFSKRKTIQYINTFVTLQK